MRWNGRENIARAGVMNIHLDLSCKHVEISANVNAIVLECSQQMDKCHVVTAKTIGRNGQTGHFETSPPTSNKKTTSVPPTRNHHGTVSNFENPKSLIIIVQFISLSSLSPTFGGHKMERQITDFFPHKPSYHIALPQPLLSSILWRGQCLTTRLSRSEKTWTP